MPRVVRRAASGSDRLGHLGLDLMNIVCGGSAFDGDLSRLHGLRDLPDQLNPEQAVVEGRALHLNIVRQVELPPEMSGRNTPVEELALGLFGLAAFDGDDVLLGRNRNFVGRKPRDCQRDQVSGRSASRSML